MNTYDSIVIGGGLAGSAIAYELVQVGQSVLLLEQSASPHNATHYSYGGIAYWSASTPLLQQICQEGIAIHRSLSEQLEGDTQFRELDMVMTIDPDQDPEAIAANYARCLMPPHLIDRDAAVEVEPLLDRHSIAAALHVNHAHVSPQAIVSAYQQAMQRLGGAIVVDRVVGFEQTGAEVTAVKTQQAVYSAAQVIVAAGSGSRQLLRSIASVPVYFTTAELIETPPVDIKLRSIVMPAIQKRFAMESEASRVPAVWDEPDREVTAPILDAGVVQLRDRSLRMGQISRTFTNLEATGDAAQSDAELRTQIARRLPALQDVPGQWRTCTVAFSGDGLPIVGTVPGMENLQVFSGFSNPFALLPPVARRFARQASADPVLAQLSIDRFGAAALQS